MLSKYKNVNGGEWRLQHPNCGNYIMPIMILVTCLILPAKGSRKAFIAEVEKR